MLHMSIPLPCSSGSSAACNSPLVLPSMGILNLPTLIEPNNMNDFFLFTVSRRRLYVTYYT
ncbi:hypothetical protein B296_00015239 [Ensete ventricosum]|uniref:Uncharacterized protein n=1 Tax=Ensete ventricosum TaxID=4639 RepID=A0A426ZXS1_ENSVE|nr:hypothetical protein B296_00015239 [Ensete ventricosum]